MRGLKIRGGSRIVNIMLRAARRDAGGHAGHAGRRSAVKGVISATTVPWEVVPSIKIEQIAKNTTAFSGDKGLYTQTFAVAMNKAAYDKLPADLKKVIDANSGMTAASLFGAAMDAGDKSGLAVAERPATRSSRSTPPRRSAGSAPPPACAPSGTKEVSAKGIDGPALAAAAGELIAKAYAGK